MKKILDMVKELREAKNGNMISLEKLIQRVEPLIKKKSYFNEGFDEDCFQELNSKLLCCIHKFEFNLDDSDFQNSLDSLQLNI